MYLEFKILRATLWNSSIFAYHLRIREIEYLLHDQSVPAFLVFTVSKLNMSTVTLTWRLLLKMIWINIIMLSPFFVKRVGRLLIFQLKSYNLASFFFNLNISWRDKISETFISLEIKTMNVQCYILVTYDSCFNSLQPIFWLKLYLYLCYPWM